MDTSIFYLFNFLLGLIIGSFISMLSYRFPRYLDKQWKNECLEYLKLPQEPVSKKDTFRLFAPRSHCPNCLNKIAAIYNIPIFSFIFLKGKCAYCQAPISIRYPLIELTTLLTFLITATFFDFSFEWALAIFFSAMLILLTVIDFEHQILPDQFTLFLVWLGLNINVFEVFSTLPDAVIGATIGYLSLWTIAKSYKLFAKKDAMGHGDFKLFAVAGAWLGWQHLPFIIMFSSLIGSIYGITMIIIGKHKFNIPIPFGPYLALAIWISFLFGDNIISLYINWFNLPYYV